MCQDTCRALYDTGEIFYKLIIWEEVWGPREKSRGKTEGNVDRRCQGLSGS